MFAVLLLLPSLFVGFTAWVWLRDDLPLHRWQWGGVAGCVMARIALMTTSWLVVIGYYAPIAIAAPLPPANWERSPVPHLASSLHPDLGLLQSQLAPLLTPSELFINPVVTSEFLMADSFPNTVSASAASELTTHRSPNLNLSQGVQQTVLDNGLTVLTKEVKTAPVVAVQIWYRVGSRNESPGSNGISHQLEHLLFKGTKTRPIQFGRLFSALGSEFNAFTSYDQTVYLGTVERHKLNALLTLEADRMQGSLIDASQLTSEKKVVVSELDGYENSPDYRLSRAVMRAALPDHPYGWPVGGTKSDVEQFTVAQVKDYYRTYYSPDNAVLVIVGDFETESTLTSVRQLFGGIPRLSHAKHRTPGVVPIPTAMSQVPLNRNKSAPSSPLAGDNRNGTALTTKPAIVLKEPGAAPLLDAVYPLPAVDHPDVPALQVMDYILSGGRSSRIYQALVETGLASEATGYAANLISGGWYEFSVTVAPNQTLQQADQALQQVVQRLQVQGVTGEELERAKTQFQADLILRHRDITSQATLLGDNQTSTGDYHFMDHLLARVQQVTPADVQRVVQLYLAVSQRTVGWFEPTETNGHRTGSAGSFSQTTENFSPGAPVDPAEVAKYLPPIPTTDSRANHVLPEKVVLSNGLKILLLPDHSTPTVTLSGHILAGSAFDPERTAGLASLTADNLLNGTRSQDALTLAKSLENRGANLYFDANREGVTINGEALANDLPVLLKTVGEVLQYATFPERELEISLQRAIRSLEQDLDNPARLGRRVFQQTVYPPNHPFHAFPTSKSLNTIKQVDVVEFYRTHYRPDTTVLTLVGDFDPTVVRAILNRELGGWQASGKPPNLRFPAVALPSGLVQVDVPMAGKPQTVSYLGSASIGRRDRLYYPALVLNQVLGGDTLSSRLGTEIRDRQGLTYGIYSYFQAGLHPGPFLIYMQTAPEDTQRAISGTLEVLKQVQTQGLTAAEVATAQRSLTSSYLVGLADPVVLADTLLTNEVYGLERTEIIQYPNRVRAVTLEDVNYAAKELLHPDRLVVITAGSS